MYSSKGNMRNINLKTAANDLNFGYKLCPVRSFIYSTFSSEFSGRIAERGLKILLN